MDASWLQKLAQALRGYSAENLNPNNAQGIGGANMFNGQQPTNTFGQGFNMQQMKPNPWGFSQQSTFGQPSMMQNPMISNAANNIPNQ